MMALAELPEGALLVHHSDRGCRYCSHRYVEKLQAHGLAISMTEEPRCYESAHADRLNGILKQEYGLDYLSSVSGEEAGDEWR
jgi:transposase InsO family protein